MKKSAFILSILFSASAFAQLPAISTTDAELTKTCNDAIATALSQLDAIAANKSEPNFDNTVAAVDNVVADLDIKTAMPMFLFYVSPSPAIRAASTECRNNIKKFSYDAFGKENLFIRFQTFKNSNKGRKLTGEDKKLLDDFYATFLISGLGVADKEQRKKVGEISKQIGDLETEYLNNIQNGRKFIQVDKSELVGMADTWIAGLTKASNGKYVITTAYPDYIPFMENAKSENARKRIYEQFNTIGGKRNVEVLEKLISLRAELAKVLGFSTHADKVFALGGRMATSTGQVKTFIDDLLSKLKPGLDSDLLEMRKLKCKDIKCKDWDKVTLNAWDVPYYINKMRAKVGDIDEQKVREYFPMSTVTSGMFQIYQQLLSIDIEKLNNIPTWDSSVEVYAVRDRASHEVLGNFYLDMYPREGKYNHAAVQGIIKSKYLGGGKYLKPVAAMVCNFSKPAGDLPSMLTHDEVETYFHEFGHIIDDMLSRSKYYSQGSGDSIYSPRMVGRSIDFAEAPSQMLENWVWKSESLAMLSGHYKTNEKLPADMLGKMLKLKNVASGYMASRQLFQATMDLDFHTTNQMDTTKAWGEKMQVITGVKMPTGVHPASNWGHMADLYDVGYYGYMWSRVFAEDMFSIFEKNGIMNSRTGMSYRKQVLEPASSLPASDAVKNFLGREPNQDAFIKSLGLTPAL